jgi:hypothetical protein
MMTNGLNYSKCEPIASKFFLQSERKCWFIFHPKRIMNLGPSCVTCQKKRRGLGTCFPQWYQQINGFIHNKNKAFAYNLKKCYKIRVAQSIVLFVALPRAEVMFTVARHLSKDVCTFWSN